MGIGELLGLAVLGLGALGQVAREAPPEHLAHRRCVIALLALDQETPVFGFAGKAVLEDNHGSHDIGALDVADVEALDAQGSLIQAEGLGQFLESLGARRQIAGPSHLVPGQGLFGIAVHGLEKALLVPALRDSHGHLRPTDRGEQFGHGLGLWGQDRQENLAGDPLG